MTTHKKILLLDLGGVLADLGDPARAIGLALTAEEFWAIWLSSSLVHAFETGQLTTTEFCVEMAPELGVPDVANFEKRFRNWKLSLFPGTDEFIQSMESRFRVALLSNTNAVHWNQIADSTEIFSGFEKTFLSFETGHFKPAAASYQQVISFFNCDPGEIMFFDDSPKNVAAACSLQIDARLVRGITEVRDQVHEA